ncbi:hypothetical protein KV580_25515 [Pseudomonas chlororaphis]|nr:hypothetical protein [Pseudomonas chlororaphis]
MDLFLALFTLSDFQLGMYCTIAAAIGGFIKAILISYDFEKPHHRQEKFVMNSDSAAFANILSRCILSAFTGLLFALLMSDAVKLEKGPVAKLLVLAVFVGYLAPDIWKSQEKKILVTIDRVFSGEGEKDDPKA